MTMVGKKLGGRYNVLEQIGAGGMAVVYKAEQPSLGRMVAIKELRTELANEESVITRFEREALSIAALGHQNIVHVYDFVKRADSMHIVMEYVEGVDLYTLLHRADRLPSDIAAIIALQAARALEYAHYRGVVHRDFKPSNLMITNEGDVKLMDFGIARDESHGDLTLPGQALGTPAYMSPEQILGERVDFRSDIFSFGIVLYQMLTGQKPFVEDETIGVMHSIINRPFVRPRALYPDIPWRLQRIVKRCLQKKAEGRYPSTEILRSELEDYVAKKVRINPSGRLLLYLRNNGLIGDEVAKTFIRQEQLDSVEISLTDTGTVSGWAAVVKPALVVHLGLLLLLAMWVGVVEIVAPNAPVGFVRVNAVPWAEVWVDGARYDVTPFSRPIALPPGEHALEFKNDRLGRSATRRIEVVAGQTQRVAVSLMR